MCKGYSCSLPGLDDFSTLTVAIQKPSVSEVGALRLSGSFLADDGVGLDAESLEPCSENGLRSCLLGFKLEDFRV